MILRIICNCETSECERSWNFETWRKIKGRRRKNQNIRRDSSNELGKKLKGLEEKQTNLIEDSKEKYKCNKCDLTLLPTKKKVWGKNCTRFSHAQNVRKFFILVGSTKFMAINTHTLLKLKWSNAKIVILRRNQFIQYNSNS